MNYKIINGSVSYGAETILEEIYMEISSATLLDKILKVYTPLKLLEIRIEDLSKKLQNSKDESLISEYTNSMEKYEFLGGYTYKKEYEKLTI